MFTRTAEGNYQNFLPQYEGPLAFADPAAFADFVGWSMTDQEWAKKPVGSKLLAARAKATLQRAEERYASQQGLLEGPAYSLCSVELLDRALARLQRLKQECEMARGYLRDVEALVLADEASGRAWWDADAAQVAVARRYWAAAEAQAEAQPITSAVATAQPVVIEVVPRLAQAAKRFAATMCRKRG